MQKSVKEQEEQLAKAGLEYEDRVHREEARRVALEDQLQAIPPAPQNVNPQPTPMDRGLGPVPMGLGLPVTPDEHPQKQLLLGLAQTARVIVGHSSAQRSIEGAVGQTHGTTSQGVIEIRGLEGHNDLILDSLHSQLHPVTIPSGGSRLSLILKLLMGVYNEQFGFSQGGATATEMPESTDDLGAAGSVSSPPPPPSRTMDESAGNQRYGTGSDSQGQSQGYYPEEFNLLNRSQPS